MLASIRSCVLKEKKPLARRGVPVKIFYTFLMFSFLTGVSSPLAAGAKLKKKLKTQNFFASYEKYLKAKK